MAKENSVAVIEQTAQVQEVTNYFGSITAFENGQRMANLFANSKFVPKAFQGDVGGCLIALNMANRMKADPLQVMQSLNVIYGKPSFSSAFLIACFNQLRRFTTIRYIFTGERGTDSWGCKAATMELATGEVSEGTTVTIGMAKAEGWYNKNGSKWQTMPELMLRYRAATFLIRTVAPEVALGFLTTEEALDITDKATIVNDVAPLSLAEVAKLAITQQAQADEQPQPEAEVLEEPDVAETKPEGGDFTSRYFKEHKKDEHED